jgi:hypothetical protein
MEIHVKMRDLSNVDTNLKPIVETLLDYEESLSDGYGYYLYRCGFMASEQAHERHNDDYVVAALEEIARVIMEKIT